MPATVETEVIEPTGSPAGDDEGRGRRLTPPSGWTLVALVLALAFLVGTVGWTVGRGRTPSKGSADVAFLYDMIRHHESAIEMSWAEVRNGSDESVKVFAREIIQFQSYEIGLMDARLQQWGYTRESPPATAMAWMGHGMKPEDMPGLPSAADLERLRTERGPSVDARYIALMMAHHTGGSAMAQAAAERADNGFVKKLARRMATNQRVEITEMEAARRRASLPAVKVDRPVTAGAASGM